MGRVETRMYLYRIMFTHNIFDLKVIGGIDRNVLTP